MILKYYPIASSGYEEKLPANCKIVGLVQDSVSPTLIVEMSPHAELVSHKFLWVKDGGEVPYDGLYIGSIFSYGELTSLYKLR